VGETGVVSPLDARETACCVSLQRAARLLAVIVGLVLLPWILGLPHPRTAGLVGPVTLICAIMLLSIPARPLLQRGPARAEIS
jgi:hypothetical protein